MLNYIEQLERERRRRTLRKLARNCGSVKQARTMVLLTVLSPDMRVVYQRAIRNSATPVFVGAAPCGRPDSDAISEETHPPVSPFSKGD